uniref:Glucose-6-phosphate 1-dehydrogenase n=2 Tax=Branchiostoma floridae TaxID=7739 RepID=C3ZBQ0_BRAFL|eukprot:XP_002594276.1 hypothetical protein BRAFLDRAFT_65130 [Branchiostoma floridae]
MQEVCYKTGCDNMAASAAVRRAAAVVFLITVLSTKQTYSKHTNVVLVGATGDLAKKYLWQGFFDLYQAEHAEGNTFSFYGGGRNNVEAGGPLLQEIVTESRKCSTEIDSCIQHRENFVEMVKYHRLKSEDDYTELCKTIEENLKQSELEERGRFFYLSVPPFAYPSVSANIHKFCRPKEPEAWLRVVVEKPFGHDLQSAEELVESLSEFFSEEELYRVDHYLGKQAVEEILPFRRGNWDLEAMWNTEHVERVEIVMKETIDVKGRLSFFDSYGIIRDVLQNHLTEILTLVAMDTPQRGNLSDFQQKKLDLYSQIQPLTSEGSLIGQYEEYNSQWQEELKKEDKDSSQSATFAAVVFTINSDRWKDVPFVVTAGKKLDERVGYVRVVFRKLLADENCIERACPHNQVIFHIGHGKLKVPAVLVSKGLPKPVVPMGWVEYEPPADMEIFDLPASAYHVYSPEVIRDAYSSLIESVYRGQSDRFVSSPHLLASWRIWTPLLKELEEKEPRKYPGGKEDSTLQYVLVDDKLYFLSDLIVDRSDAFAFSTSSSTGTLNLATLPSLFRGQRLVSGESDKVITQLANDIKDIALQTLQTKELFHIAFSGGKSPLKLLNYLVLESERMGFPWKQTLIWFVDERCVPHNDERSNFHFVEKNLLRYLDIPMYNVNPMPVGGAYEECDVNGADQHHSKVSNILDGAFDYVLLGVGSDGHTASLFPGSPALQEREKYVAITDATGDVEVKQRMTLTFKSINKSGNVGVLLLGKGKHGIVKKLQDGGVDVEKLPITGVKPKQDSMTWYIDHQALFGQ